MNLRYVARADGATDPVIVIVVNITVINALVVVVALRHGGRAISVADLVQIAHAHGGSDARRHYRYDLIVVIKAHRPASRRILNILVGLHRVRTARVSLRNACAAHRTFTPQVTLLSSSTSGGSQCFLVSVETMIYNSYQNAIWICIFSCITHKFLHFLRESEFKFIVDIGCG